MFIIITVIIIIIVVIIHSLRSLIVLWIDIFYLDMKMIWIVPIWLPIWISYLNTEAWIWTFNLNIQIQILDSNCSKYFMILDLVVSLILITF